MMIKFLFIFLFVPYATYTQESNDIDMYRHEKIFECTDCHYVAKTRYDLRKHRRSHTGEQPYCCDVCFKYFSASSSLYRHQRLHTGEKPYICGTCFKAFADLSNYNHHVKGHDEKEYVCSICHTAFTHKYSLNKHEATKLHQLRARASQHASHKDATSDDEIDWHKVEDIIKSAPPGFFSLPE